jgi:hypothetical protein
MIHIIHMRKTGVKHVLQLVLILFLLIISDILRENLQLNAYLRLYVLYCFLTFFILKCVYTPVFWTWVILQNNKY